MCEENVNELLKWVNSVEHKIATVGGPRENIDDLRNQINALKVKYKSKQIFLLTKYLYSLFSKSRMKLKHN